MGYIFLTNITIDPGTPMDTIALQKGLQEGSIKISGGRNNIRRSNIYLKRIRRPIITSTDIEEPSTMGTGLLSVVISSIYNINYNEWSQQRITQI